MPRGGCEACHSASQMSRLLRVLKIPAAFFGRYTPFAVYVCCLQWAVKHVIVIIRLLELLLLPVSQQLIVNDMRLCYSVRADLGGL